MSGYTYQAEQSVSGHWAVLMTNGKAGSYARTWLEVDDKTIPVSDGQPWQLAWSPDGQELAVLSGPTPASMKLWTYNVLTGQRSLYDGTFSCSTLQIKEANRQATNSLQLIAWSHSGRYLSVRTDEGIVTYDSTSPAHPQTLLSEKASTWGWAENDMLYTLSATSTTSTDVTFYAVDNVSVHPVNPPYTLPGHVTQTAAIEGGNLIVQTSQKVFELLGPQSYRKMPVNPDVWWYNTHNQSIYYATVHSKGSVDSNRTAVWSIPLMESGNGGESGK